MSDENTNLELGSEGFINGPWKNLQNKLSWNLGIKPILTPKTSFLDQNEIIYLLSQYLCWND